MNTALLPLRSSLPLRRLIGGSIATLLLAIVACGASIGLAYAQSPASAPPEDAKAILMRMADYMSKLPRFSVHVRDSYDTYQTTGQKIEYGETRTITVVRPDRLRVELEESDGDSQVVMFDGKDLTVASPSDNVFAQTPKPGTIDDAIVFFVRDLRMRLPFAPLLIANFPAEIEQRTQTLAYVEKTSIYGAPAHHLAGRTESVDYQVWVADGDKPLPQRLVLTYREAEGHPQFRAQFSDWNLTPKAPDSMFTFTAPPGARRIAFLAQLPRSATPPAPEPAKSEVPK